MTDLLRVGLGIGRVDLALAASEGVDLVLVGDRIDSPTPPWERTG